MEKEEIIKKLQANHYSFDEKDDQIIVNITRKCHFIMALDHEQLMNYKEIIRSTIRFRKDVSLKSELYNAIIGTVVMILLSIGWNWAEEVSLIKFNVFHGCTLGYLLGSFIPILYYHIRFTRIKKLLNLV